MVQKIELLTSPHAILSAKKALIGSNHKSFIAIAFWGRGAVEELGIPGARKGTKIILNADSGACNPSELVKLKALTNVEVKNSPKLHAKVIVGQDTTIVGSANASANGLGFQGKEQSGWYEACIRTAGAAEARELASWFDALWRRSEALGDAVIARAKAAWLRRRQAALPANGLPEADISRWDGLPVYVVTTDEDSDYSEVDASNKAKLAGLNEDTLDYYQDWSSMPKNALLLNYAVDRRSGKAEFEGPWTTISPVRCMTLEGGKKVYPVFKAEKAMRSEFGLKASKTDLKWNEAVTRFNKLMKDPAIASKTKEQPGVEINRSTD